MSKNVNGFTNSVGKTGVKLVAISGSIKSVGKEYIDHIRNTLGKFRDIKYVSDTDTTVLLSSSIENISDVFDTGYWIHGKGANIKSKYVLVIPTKKETVVRNDYYGVLFELDYNVKM